MDSLLKLDEAGNLSPTRWVEIVPTIISYILNEVITQKNPCKLAGKINGFFGPGMKESRKKNCGVSFLDSVVGVGFLRVR